MYIRGYKKLKVRGQAEAFARSKCNDLLPNEPEAEAGEKAIT